MYHGNLTMLNNLNPLLSKAEWCRKCIHLLSLKLNHFKMVEVLGLKITALRFP
jgi:hypothetical protein